MTVKSGRKELKDQKFDEDLSNLNLMNTRFVRAVALKKKFENINFRYAIFESAYFRNCSFINCDFTGCRFINSNLVGSAFSGCVFDYATFYKTFVDNDILISSCPVHENLKLKFARSLRINYQQLGDTKSTNKAVNAELAAEKMHHHKAVFSKEKYYREKYSGRLWFYAVFEWASFNTLEFLWGNGESLFKLARTVVLVLIFISFLDVQFSGQNNEVASYWRSLTSSPQVFFGIKTAPYIPNGWVVAIYFVRLVLFAFFISIVIKRFNRR